MRSAVSVPTVRAALRRLKANGEIADPYPAFYVIVPPEHRRLGSLPADQYARARGCIGLMPSVIDVLAASLGRGPLFDGVV